MKQIGDVLTRSGLITSLQLEKGLLLSSKQNLRLGEALIDLGFISEADLLTALAKQFGLPCLGSEEMVVDPTVLRGVSAQIAREYLLIPIRLKGAELLVATSDPMNIMILEDLETRMKRRISLALVGKNQIMRAIERFYSGRENDICDEVAVSRKRSDTDDLLRTFDSGDNMAQGGNVVKFVNQVLMGALRERASDIHFERDGSEFQIRQRIDGILKTMYRPKLQLCSLIIARLKVMAKLDVSKHRIPQDGAISMNIDGKSIDFRISVSPCVDGENVTIRILNRESRIPDLPQLGFTTNGLKRLEKLLSHNSGLILVAGQTGSGKTTTLYSILQRLNSEENKIITIEDPVEIRLPRLNQIQVDPKADLTFASGLKMILRMDPDIILVGEIRDRETAEIAVNAAMTGHLVFSSLHCGTTGEVPSRLFELRIEPYLISNVLLGMIAQRLVRLNCPICLEPETLSPQLIERFQPEFQSFRGKGCSSCAGIGYRGRVGLEEILVVDSPIRQLIQDRSGSHEIEEESVRQGMNTLKDSGIEKVRARLTSFAELAKVL
ncbi:MAG: ATPase, T2SS/T4P/T4SS family [Candidatus Ozemobacteraceae bacterium]